MEIDRRTVTALLASSVALAPWVARAEGAADAAIPPSSRIEPAALAALLASAAPQPMLIQVGSAMLYAEAHIPGSTYAGPAGKPDGLQKLDALLSGQPKDKAVAIYCGCCPWTRCPNIGAAYTALQKLGFADVRALHLANNFGDDWVARGYPVAHGS
jgi:thiosulfate/3-mercaptopyruvate sulfurtransferase